MKELASWSFSNCFVQEAISVNNIEQKPMKTSEWVLLDLKNQWTAGRLKAGDKLASVEELATQYHVGRSTIREALSALKMLGMLTMKQGGGTYVNAFSGNSTDSQHPLFSPTWLNRAQSLKHILEVRRLLETGCAQLAALHRKADDIQQLSQIMKDMRIDLEDETRSEQADVQFHLGIAKATHNPLLITLMESISEKLHDSMRDSRTLWFYAERSSAERLLLEHQSILDAIVQQRPQIASQRMEHHIQTVEEVLMSHITKTAT